MTETSSKTPQHFTLNNGRTQWRGQAASLADALVRANRKRFDLRGLIRPGAELSEAGLNMLALHGAGLSGAAFKNSELVLTDLIGADLWVANFMCANLADADLSGAEAAGANFEGANLADTRLCWTNLERANLKLAVMTGTDLTGTNLRGVTGLSLTQMDEADTDAVQADLIARLARQPGLAQALKAALEAGVFDGDPDAPVPHTGLHVSAFGTLSPASQWLRRLTPGLPERDPVRQLTDRWLRDWTQGR